MKRKYIQYIILSIIILFIIFLCRSCYPFWDYAEEEMYTSPEGSHTIIVKYDLVCRPDVFKKGLLWDKKIWDYPGSGFMETVHFGVEWISENEILLTYEDVTHNENNEEYDITIPGP